MATNKPVSAAQERFEVLHRLHRSMGDLDYALAVFGYELAKRERYKDPGLVGLDAIHFYLVHKFNWTPAQVRGMSLDDLRFVLTEEMHGYRMPPEAVKAAGSAER